MYTQLLCMMGMQEIDTGVFSIGESKRKRCNFQRNWESPKYESSVVKDRIRLTGMSMNETTFCLHREQELEISDYHESGTWPRKTGTKGINSDFSYYIFHYNDVLKKTQFHLPYCRNDKTYIDSSSQYRKNHLSKLLTLFSCRTRDLLPMTFCLKDVVKLPPSSMFSLLTPLWFTLVPRGRRQTGHLSPTALLYAILIVLHFLSGVRLVNACYHFPPGIRNPCEGQECKFGAECKSSIDGKVARCQCPSDCPSYGDNVGSVPVCGTDGVNYANECEMRKNACQKLDVIRVKYYGRCDPCEGHVCEAPKVCMINNNKERQPECMCSFVCPSEINLVCGTDGRTYSNNCFLRQQACKSKKEIRVLNSGKCGPDHPCTKIKCGLHEECSVTKSGAAVCLCPKECPHIFRRVCGTDGITYDNECELRKSACTEKVNVTFKHDGPCGPNQVCSTKVCHYGSMCVEHAGKAVCRCPQCTEEYNPVCGDNGITYQNDCKLKLENCQREENVKESHKGACADTCGNQRCHNYAICERVNNKPKCICPTSCVQVDDPVCGNDGVTYANECEMRVESCRTQKFIGIGSKGTCDKCRNVTCNFHAKCENGVCVCPILCATVNEPVCASDGNDYHNECEMKKYSCSQNVFLSVSSPGRCDSPSGSGALPSGDDALITDDSDDMPTTTSKTSTCSDENCFKYGGSCVLEGLQQKCVCLFTCKAIRDTKCGSDGLTYSNECTMSYKSCQTKTIIKPQPLDNCDVLDDAEPCDGAVPLVNPDTNEDYDCSANTCPANSYCHVKFSKCCRQESAPLTSCREMPFGCCPDKKTPANDPKGRGCPDVCKCNSLGSISTTCDPVTKQCTCKPGVSGKKCDRCEMGYWGLHKIGEVGNSGCIPCSCNKFGASRDDCDQMTGRCMCKPHVEGFKCDRCLNGKVLGPGGCQDLSPMSCYELDCRFEAVCREKDGTPFCDCENNCDYDTHPSDIVCATNGQTFGSLCQLEYYACRFQQDITVANKGPCRGSPSVLTTTASPDTTDTKSRKTTRHIEGSGGDTYIDDNTIKNPYETEKEDVMTCTGSYIENLCLSNKDCCPAHSHCHRGLCYCKEGYVPNGDNTKCYEIKAKPTETIHSSITACTNNPCQAGTCILDKQLGYRCACPLGKIGPLCNRAAEFATPSFSGRSHLEVRRIEKATQELSIEVDFSTLNKDGIILFHPQNRDGTGDFVSLAVNDGYVEFRYDLGAGPAILRSRDTIEPIRVHRVIARRSKEAGILLVDKEKSVSGSSPPTLTSLDLGDSLYLGYMPQASREVYDKVGVDLGLVGCIHSLRAGKPGDMRTYKLDYSKGLSDIKAGVDITECDKNPCKSMPCQNEGTCIVLDAQHFECQCSSGFKGKTCDTIVNPCASQPCLHGGTCVPVSSSDGFYCQCAQSYEGSKCERESIPEVFVPQFTGDSYLEIPLPEIMTTSLSITVWFMTTKPDGLIVLVTQKPRGEGDFIALMLENSSLVYTFYLGSGIGRIESKKHIHLDKWHKVTISRNGRIGQMTIDAHAPITGEATFVNYVGPSTALNIDKRPLYLGGYNLKSDVPAKLGSRAGFTGAIQRIIINGRTIVGLLATAVTMRNISTYSGPPCNINPCMNEGVCIPMLHLAECRCTANFMGERCEKHFEQIDKDQPIRFNGTTFLSFLNEITRRVEGQQSNDFSIKFRSSEPDGILLLQRSGDTVQSDYLSVAVSNGYVELSFNLGRHSTDKLFIVRSKVKVDDGQWHHAVISRQHRIATVQVDNEEPVRDTFPISSQQLDTDGILWIGGRDSLAWELPTMKNFVGCINEVTVNNHQLHLVSDRLSQSSTIVFCT
ncbi:agrin-like isoform X3 [Biomphalaria pfeifferi]|uniref:Agrin-like isoform X3 n=1 Tax=Biomphalaria pfeifferi TaxID=112525 RepID=A0AAD8BLL5_BIOPF|nr:agrin-like isoform X3 [Biomphalaria pfeifferi]